MDPGRARVRPGCGSGLGPDHVDGGDEDRREVRAGDPEERGHEGLVGPIFKKPDADPQRHRADAVGEPDQESSSRGVVDVGLAGLDERLHPGGGALGSGYPGLLCGWGRADVI